MSPPADKEWFEALSGEGSSDGVNAPPEATQVAAATLDTPRPALQPAAEGAGQDSVSQVEAVPPIVSGKALEDYEPVLEEALGRVPVQERILADGDGFPRTNGGHDAVVLAPARNGSPVGETDEIDLLELLAVLRKRSGLVVTVVLAAVVAAVLFSAAMPRRYEVTTQILVRDVPQARAAGVTAQTLAAFAVSDQVLRTVSQETSPETLRRSFSVRLDSTARVLTLTVSAGNAGDAFLRAQKWLDGFTVEASRLVGVEPASEPLVRVFVAPSFPEKPVSPRVALNIAVSLLMGLFVGSAAALALDAMEKVQKREV